MSALALRSKAHWGYSEEFLDACKAELTVDPDRFGANEYEHFVYCDNKSILGFYALEKLSADAYELEALFVDPAHIGTGVGRALMQHAIVTATKRGAARLIIQGDPNASRFYVGAGARQIGYKESDSIPGRYLPLYEIRIGDH